MRRHFVLIAGLLWAAPLAAQQGTGAVVGKVVDGTTQEPVPGVEVAVPSTPYRATTAADGTFRIVGIPAGAHQLRATRIGYRPDLQDLSVTAGGTATVNFTMSPAAALLQEVVVTGYGTQRREAITGSVASITADVADVGVVPNVNTMLSGRAAGLNVTLNSGEPGASSQILIRGGTSLSASNEPLYVIDGVPINNVSTEAAGIGVGGGAQLARSPLNMVNPADIQSITVLKDAAAAAIYGSRAANGVILIETKKGGSAGAGIEYDGYVAAASPSRYLNVLDGNQYRQFIQDQVSAGNLPATSLAGLGTANTNWERAVTRTAYTHNHDISFTGGTQDTRYRASLNYMKQEGVLISSGLERIQARLNATHNAFDNRLRIALNVTTSHVYNDYVSHQNTGGFEGDVLQNVAVFNPTEPIKVLPSGAVDSAYYEIGAGSQSVRNPVALANQLLDFGHDTRTLGNASAEFDLVPGLTAQVNVGADRSSGLRQIYFPNSSPVGAPDGGLAQQSDHTNSAVTLQTLLTLNKQTSSQTINVVGGYEYDKYNTSEFVAEGHGYVSDAFTFNNLAGAAVLVPPTSYLDERKYVSFFGRANYGLKDRYFLTGVLRYDGASQFGTGNKWGTFPALSASWHLSDEGFMQNLPLPDLRLRFGWGLQGNPAVPPYSSLLQLSPDPGARAVFGQGTVVTGVVPTSCANPDLKWEQTGQWNGAVDFNAWNSRLSGTVEYYVKNTSDLLLQVPVTQPATCATRLENVGSTRNRGLEVSLDVLPISKRDFTWRAGVAFAMNRNKVVDLGPYQFITTGNVSGQGQSNQVSERLIPGEPIGTFYGPVFVGWNSAGTQLFQCQATSAGCTNGQTTAPTADDYQIIGNANPDFTLGVSSQINAGKFDISFLVNSWVGNDVFNNTALVYSTKSDALQNKNFLAAALTDPTGIHEPAIYSSRWIENGSFVRLQNLTVGYTFHLPGVMGGARTTRLYVSGDNLLLLTGYSGYDPEVYTDAGLATRGLDYLSYPRPRTFTAGVHVAF
jgi:TonB-linked SusC/RagA family outer membrane protein